MPERTLISRRFWFFIAALVGAIAASAGVLAGLHPFNSAQANTPSGVSEPPDARIAIALRHFEPGAVVKLTENGGFSIYGTRRRADSVDRASTLEKAGPSNIRCSGSGVPLTCTPVPDNTVVAALKGGETIFGRAVYVDIPAGVDATAPMLSADELVCGAASAAGSLSCTPVSAATPMLAPGETAFATYKPFRVRFEGDRLIGQGDTPTIPLVRASG